MSKNSHPTASKNLLWSISINVIIVIFEIIFGLLSGSFALITDALHNLSDIGSMVLSYWGEKLSDKPKTKKKTYGYKRAGVLIAFVNGAVLLGVVGFVLIESVIRIFNPEPVSSVTMMVVAGIALLGNGLATYLLQKGAGINLNLKSAWLHSTQDALFSLGVIVSAGIIYVTGWIWLDPLASIIISIFLLKAIYSIISEAIDMILDSVPKDLDFEEVKNSLLANVEVIEINDLHIWQTDSRDRFLSAHMIIKEMEKSERIKVLAKIITLLKKKYNIYHSTLQMVSKQEVKEIGLECEHFI
ncbi:MAG: cation diffusion facilitator family transporter [Patescibacteria group bacterium]